MATITIGTEQEASNHWRYDVTVEDRGQSYHFDVTLSWADYDLWCKGRIPPERVIQAAFAFLLEREPASSILARFDCSVMRRYFSEVDEELPKLLSIPPNV